MKTTWKTRAAVGVAAVALAGSAAWGIGVASADTTSPSPSPTSTASTTTTAPADAELTKTLTQAREEERMVRDLYAAFADLYGEDSHFDRISNAEQHHFDAVGRMLQRYGIADPSQGQQAGKYADESLQKLYDTKLAEGRKSVEAAYQVGVDIETQDIADLDKAIQATGNADAKRVLEHLKAGSEQHLRAFTTLKDGGELDPATMRDGMGGRGMGPGGMGMHRDGRGMGGQGMGTGNPEDCPNR